MKVTIRNLGTINEMEISLKPLTIFIGPNNTGKTWTAYMLAGIFGPYGWDQYRKTYSIGEVTETYPSIDNAIQKILDEGNAKIDLAQFADDYGEQYINNVGKLTRIWMREFMVTQRASFENLEVHFSLEEEKSQFIKRVLDAKVDSKLSVTKRKALLTALKESGTSDIYFYTEGEIKEKLPLRVLKNFLGGNVFQVFHRAFYRNTRIFPTERTMIVTLPIFGSKKREEIITAEKRDTLSHDRTQEDKEMEVDVNWPLERFVALLERSSKVSLINRKEKSDQNPIIKKYIDLAQILEKEILGGGLDFSTPEPTPSREVLFQPSDNVFLEMPIVSSMVKELSPLVLYLRYIAEPGDWLVIDEPEMNLHPEAQARLTEFLSLLSQSDLQILLTTHSPYVIDHLVNLMKAATLEDNKSVESKFYLKRTEAFIPKSKVSIYLFQDSTAKNILKENGLIDWGTFGGVSEHISQLYFEL